MSEGVRQRDLASAITPDRRGGDLIRSAIGQRLSQLYEAVTREPLPAVLAQALEELDTPERSTSDCSTLSST